TCPGSIRRKTMTECRQTVVPNPGPCHLRRGSPVCRPRRQSPPATWCSTVLQERARSQGREFPEGESNVARWLSNHDNRDSCLCGTLGIRDTFSRRIHMTSKAFRYSQPLILSASLLCAAGSASAGIIFKADFETGDLSQ